MHYQPSLGSLFLLLVWLSLGGLPHGSWCHIFHHSVLAAALSDLSTIQCWHISPEACYGHCHGWAASPHCSKVFLSLQLFAEITLQKTVLPVNLKSHAKACFVRFQVCDICFYSLLCIEEKLDTTLILQSITHWMPSPETGCSFSFARVSLDPSDCHCVCWAPRCLAEESVSVGSKWLFIIR